MAKYPANVIKLMAANSQSRAEADKWVKENWGSEEAEALSMLLDVEVEHFRAALMEAEDDLWEMIQNFAAIGAYDATERVVRKSYEDENGERLTL